MHSINIDASNFQNIIDEFRGYFAGAVETYHFGMKFIVGSPDGKGIIDVINLDKDKFIIEFQCDLRRELTLKINTTGEAPLYMFYPMDKGSRVRVNNAGPTESIPKYQPLILKTTQDKCISLTIPKNEPAAFLLIKVNSKKYTEKMLKNLRDGEVFNTFISIDKPINTIIHACAPNLYIADIVQRLSHHQLKEPYGIFVLAAEIDLIVGHILGQYVTDIKSENDNFKLTNRELEKIQELAAEIAQRPGDTYTLNQITYKTGLNPNKIQTGFKYYYGNTVANFIREKRLVHAAELLSTNEYNVTEVVAKIGLNSASYFTKIFKDKYHCSPKRYQDQVKQHKIARNDITTMRYPQKSL